MSSLKDIQKLSLPIPQFDKDLNLIRFKAIFKLLQEVQNDIINNMEIVVDKVTTIEIEKIARIDELYDVTVPNLAALTQTLNELAHTYIQEEEPVEAKDGDLWYKIVE